MPAYATRDDVFALALTAKAFVTRAQPVDDVDTATGLVRLRAHGLTADDVIYLEVTSGGSLPTGLVANQAYGVEPVSFDLLRIVDGTPVTSYAEGGEGWSVQVDQMRRLDRHLEAAAARIDEHLTAHATPLKAPYPVQVVELNARLAARRMVGTLAFENSAYGASVEQLNATVDQDEKLLDRWFNGRPIHPRPTDQTTTADNGARAGRARTPSNWTTGRLWS